MFDSGSFVFVFAPVVSFDIGFVFDSGSFVFVFAPGVSFSFVSFVSSTFSLFVDLVLYFLTGVFISSFSSSSSFSFSSSSTVSSSSYSSSSSSFSVLLVDDMEASSSSVSSSSQSESSSSESSYSFSSPIVRIILIFSSDSFPFTSFTDSFASFNFLPACILFVKCFDGKIFERNFLYSWISISSSFSLSLSLELSESLFFLLFMLFLGIMLFK